MLTGRRWQATPEGATIRLYRNNRDGTFTTSAKKPAWRAVFGPAASRWPITTTTVSTIRSSPAGARTSCFTTTATAPFPEVTEKAGLLHPGVRYGSGCTWIDYDRDGKLDPFVAHYMVFDRDRMPARGKDPACNYRGIAVYCRPDGMPQESAACTTTTATAPSPT